MFQGRLAAFAAILLGQVALAAAPALAQQAFSSAAPFDARKSVLAEALRGSGALAARLVELPPPDPDAAEALRKRNSNAGEKRLEIGFARSLAGRAGAESGTLAWERVEGGRVARWEVASPGAAAVRIGLEVAGFPRGAQLRYAGIGDPGTIYGPFGGEAVQLRATYWSPVLEGERGTIEIFVPEGGAPVLDVRLRSLSHLIASPRSANLEQLLKSSGACEVDLVCRSATDVALADTGRAVARMSYIGDDGGSYTCTGTLLATTTGAGAPYFYTAAHCIGTPTEASTLTTHWNFDFTTCGGSITSVGYVQVTGGATLLYANGATDVVLLRLDDSPPGTALYAGWNAAPFANGTPVTAVHHPAGDRKKVSLGTMGGYSLYGGAPGSTHIIALWNSTATGVTEGGSSGSGIFTAVGASPVTSYQLRGGLHGGPSSCTATGVALRDYYSRFDNAYPSLRQYLDASCNFALGANGAAAGTAGGPGSFSVTSAGCTWTAVSDASWITTSSTGTGSGNVSYAVAANFAGARSGTITVGSRTFSITQPAGHAGTDVLSNGDFELGAVGWTQTSTEGIALIASEPGVARGGTYDARLGGYISGTDVLYQDFTVPANASAASLRFWRRITTDESGSTPYDTLVVALVNPSTGATLATLATLSNAHASASWVEATYDVSSHIGQAVRVRFTASHDDSYVTTFRLDDVSVNAVTATVTDPPRLGNISTRMQVLTGNDVLIGGFVIGGSANKTVVVRARGPSLIPFGITNALANPSLQLVRSSDQVTLATNDDFGTAANLVALNASSFAPGNALEAAILVSLPPGAYTAIVSGAGGGTGVGIVEVFEVDGASIPLVNISTRGQVLTGNDVMIGGFVIQGDGPQSVVVRARGPSLIPFGITNALADPTLQLVRSSDQVTLATNDNWQSAANAAAITASGFAPSNNLESAILMSLPPGAYTAIVSGVAGGSGVGIIEVFAQ